jgi:choline dehydrogenase
MANLLYRGCKLVGALCAVVVIAATPACDDGGDAAEGNDDQVCLGGKCDDIDDGEAFEFIIVGSGAGGGPLAANLARNNHRVLLLEAGSDQGGNINYQVPAYHGFSTEDPAMRWDFFVEHYSDAARQGRDSKIVLDEAGQQKGILYPRAGTLGGCTAHNAMIMIEAHDSDWNGIAEATGDRSWGADVMRPYSDRVFRWLGTETVDTGIALFDFKLQSVVMAGVFAFVDATGEGSLKQLFSNIEQLKSLLRRNVNDEGPGVEGVYPFPLAMDGGKRRGVREYLRETQEQGFPLTIETGTFVTNLVYDDRVDENGQPIVVGVEFVRGDHLYRADPNAPASGELPAKQTMLASREVIVSAGVFNTPQILKLSGIGPRAELESLGVPVKVDLPGVGENMQDRYEVGVVHRTRGEFSVLKECTLGQDPATDPCLEEWQNGEGPYRSNGGAVTIIKRSSRELLDPDLFIFGVPGKFGGYEPGYSTDALADRSLFTWLVLKGHTKNKAGTVKLRSTDPRDTPRIEFHYFDEGHTANGEAAHDLDAMVRGVNFVRDIGRKARVLMGAPFFGRYDEISPGPDAATADEVAEWVEDEAWGHHASCTAKMGGDDDPMAVLDSHFRVRGVSGLRVVDASVFPSIPGFFIVLPTFMISEKATDVILGDIGETRIEANQP